MSDATRLIDAMNQGDPHAAAQLLPLVYDELRRLARGRMVRERNAHTLEATALVHEAYLRLIGQYDSNGQCPNWNGRGHFFAAAAEAMRRILIEHARRKAAIKSGGNLRRVELEEDWPAISSPAGDADDVVALDEALSKLAIGHPEKVELVELLYFAGLSLDEAASALSLSRSTAYRQWTFSRAWLYEAMKDGGEVAPPTG
jgi:RNA polymerase sigma factor (TIGR02999 family)